MQHDYNWFTIHLPMNIYPALNSFFLVIEATMTHMTGKQINKRQWIKRERDRSQYVHTQRKKLKIYYSHNVIIHCIVTYAKMLFAVI